MRILVVDDEARLSRHILSALTEAGHEPVAVFEGESAVRAGAETAFDLVILDVGLPGIDGFEVLRRLRGNRVTSRVLMLSARGELKDRLTGLRLGADDYLPKPFAMQELLARIRALSRRFAEQPALEWRVGDLVLDLVDQTVRRNGERLDLSTREFALLKVLMREPGRVFTRTELCERVWEREHKYDMRLIEVFVGRLRKKIASPPLIHTIRHIGYMIRSAK